MSFFIFLLVNDHKFLVNVVFTTDHSLYDKYGKIQRKGRFTSIERKKKILTIHDAVAVLSGIIVPFAAV